MTSQVVLSLQLPFAIVPLIRFTSSRQIVGAFASPPWMRWLAYSSALLIIGLNGWLVARMLQGGSVTGSVSSFFAGLVALICSALLAWVAFAPLSLASGPVSAKKMTPIAPTGSGGYDGMQKLR